MYCSEIFSCALMGKILCRCSAILISSNYDGLMDVLSYWNVWSISHICSLYKTMDEHLCAMIIIENSWNFFRRSHKFLSHLFIRFLRNTKINFPARLLFGVREKLLYKPHEWITSFLWLHSECLIICVKQILNN